MNPVKVKSRLLLLELNCRPLLLGCSVRYYARKPRWVPIAKSKMFVNKELPYQPVYEEEEITRLTNNYQIYNKSLWAFQSQINAEQDARTEQVTHEGTEDAEWDRMIALVERDNKMVRDIREKQRTLEWKDVEKEVLESKKELEKIKIKELEETEKQMHTQLEKLKHVITEDNLEQEIQKALGTVVDYNFGIDKDGHLYRGRVNHDKAEDISTTLIKDPYSGIQASSTVK